MTLYNIISPTSLVAGAPEDISIILANLQSIAGVLNGNLDDTNYKDGSASPIKLAPGPANSKLVTLSGPAVWTPDMGYGTSLPSTPVDGQEHILVDSLTAPTYQWHFRYNAGSSSAYKWEFVGGTDLIAYVAAQEPYALNTYGDLTTVGPQLTVPREGDYQVGLQAQYWQSGASAVHGYASFTVGVTAPSDTEAVLYVSGGNGVIAGGQAHWVTKTGLTATTVLKMQYRGHVAQAHTFARRSLSLRPMRIS